MQDPVQYLPPVTHPHRCAVGSRLIDCQADISAAFLHFVINRLDVADAVDTIAAAMGKPDLQVSLCSRAFRQIRIGRAAQDCHSGKLGDRACIAADAPADEASHRGAGEYHGASSGPLRRMIDQSRRLRDTFLVKGRDGRRVIGAAVLVCEILQPVEVAAKADVVHAETPVAAPPVDEDHGEGLPLVATNARHLQ